MPSPAPGEVLLVYFVLLGIAWRHDYLLAGDSLKKNIVLTLN